jgi:malate/lactate dehydrogenase
MVNNPLQARSSDCLKVRTVKQHVDILMCSKKKVSTNGPTKLVISSMTTIDSVRFRGPMLLSHLNGKRESLGC